MESKQHATIRKATPADLAAINDIYNDAVVNTTATFQIEPLTIEERHAWLHEHPEHFYPALVAEADTAILGWGSLSRYASRCAYRFTSEDSIYVSPDHRGKGIGALILRHLIAAARTLGHHSIVAQIADNNAASIRLHERFGFRTVGQLPEVGHKFGRWLDVTIMQKILTEEVRT